MKILNCKDPHFSQSPGLKGEANSGGFVDQLFHIFAASFFNPLGITDFLKTRNFFLSGDESRWSSPDILDLFLCVDL